MQDQSKESEVHDDQTKETEVKDLDDNQLNEEELDDASGGIAPICKNSGIGCTQSFTIIRGAKTAKDLTVVVY